jgi:acyl transferase domain-containing protein/NADPH:quinone reductase-like Zn-dependent oxidoreductase/acyl carrier protein/SAM-dependent methyltransferase
MKPSPDPAATETLIVEALAARLGIDAIEVDTRERFSAYGLDSLRAAALIGDLSAAFGRQLPPTVVWDYPTIDALARYLNGEAPAPIDQRPPGNLIASSEPIAIVGMACRFPGASSLEDFWRQLTEGRDAIAEVPAGRWSAGEIFDRDIDVPGKATTRWGGFLDRVDEFDAAFFGISPREALQMDPQQRLIAEVAWEALEDALIPADTLRGSATGVFVGAMWSEYSKLATPALEDVAQHSATGQDIGIIANRVSYLLGLEGPSLTVNTACSSSLVALHLACQSLRSGESTAALAGGVNLMLVPDSTVAMSKFGAMSSDGHCKAFDARANGYVRGEGAGVVVLKTLQRAIADGDRVYCVIRGSAVNNDGFSNGLTAPNPAAQEKVLRSAYAAASVLPQDVQYIEAHGTGTMLGDPIEANALGRVLGVMRDASAPPLRIGSVKTNLGHLEAAAGIAGLIKTALSMQRGELVASLHYAAPNPHIDFERFHLKVQTSREPWEGSGRIAGVSSFGFGGTNAHVVLASHDAPAASIARTVFVFSGNGSQWAGMGRSLMRDEPLFRQTMDECDAAFLRAGGGWSIVEEIASPSARFDRVDVTQPILCAYQIALSALLRSWDLMPSAVIGHSVGEIAAAHAASALNLDEAMAIVFHRSRLQQRAAGNGAMLFVRASADVVRQCGGEIACLNGPLATVASGSVAEIAALESRLAERGVTAIPVRVDVAYHSAQMDPLLAELGQSLAHLKPGRANVPFHSTVTGAVIDNLDASYWVRNMREPVRLIDAVTSAYTAGSVFIEIGPSPVLASAIRESVPDAAVRTSGRRTDDERGALLDLITHLLVLSARDDAALNVLRHEYARLLESERIEDVCLSAAAGRSHLPYRLAVTARNAKEMRAKLLANDVHRGRATAHTTVLANANVEETAAAWVQGGNADLRSLQRGGRRIRLPSYPFQRQRYWPARFADLPAIENALIDRREELRQTAPVLYGDLVPALNAVTLSYLQKAFRDLEDGSTAPRHERLARRLRNILADPPQTAAQPFDVPKEAKVIFDLLDRCGTRLTDLLQDRCDPLEILFPGGDVGQMKELYSSSPFAAGLNALIAVAVERAISDLVSSRPLRIIELGGGTGGTTSSIVPLLASKNCRYTFTDVSSHFFAAARKDFAAYPFVDYRTFDIERDLESQQFAAQSFDLLVAVNVLHVASDLRAALRRARSLVRSGGVLIIGEVTAAHPWLDVVAGVLPGWWNFADFDLRPSYPLLTQSQWRDVLREEGFSTAFLIPAPEREGLASEQAVIVARSEGQALAGSVRAAAVDIPRDMPKTNAPRPLQNAAIGTAMEATHPSPFTLHSSPFTVIRAEVAAMLGYADPSSVDPTRGFFELGLDSLMAVALRDRLEKHFGRNLASSALFDYPTVDALARHIAGEVDTPRNAVTVRDDDDPIAIVGLACRFPGARDAAAFWRLLRDGEDAIRDVPAERWDIDEWFDPDVAIAGKMNTRSGGFLDGVDLFDAAFFGVSPREATKMDPQQRILLETAWHALEDAGEAGRVAGSATGVFIGVSSTDYLQLSVRSGQVANDAFALTGQSINSVAGRLSYFLGTRAPAIAIDTACSSSAVAVHLAAQSLRSGESRMALAGGVNLILVPESTVVLSKARMMAPDGRCKTFDARADGFVRAEGCGIVVLKRLSDAVADGNRVMAVLRASAINHDGRTSGYTVPNGVAQQSLIRDALARANAAPADVSYVEAHGTGTALGDPIEAGALAAVFGGRTDPLFLGSVKTNIGHAEAAAGVAGLIKVVLALQHGSIPPNLHMQNVNPDLHLDTIPALVPSTLTPWPAGKRLAGVSSFGASGTNAHLLVEQAPEIERRSDSDAVTKHLLTLSAKSEAALRALMESYRGTLSTTTESIGDICYTTNVGRAHFPWRIAVEGSTIAELIAALRDATPALFDGAEVDWTPAHRGRGRRFVALPLYPFERDRYWIELADTPRAATLLGKRLRLADRQRTVFENRVAAGHFPELEEHVVNGTAILPATFFIELALAAGRETFSERCAVADFSIVAPMPLRRASPFTVQTLVDRSDDSVRIVSADDDHDWVLHAEGRLVRDEEVVRPIAAASCDEIDVAAFYAAMERRGIAFGPSFRGLRSLATHGSDGAGTIDATRIDAVSLDAALQVAVAVIDRDELLVPISFERVDVFSEETHGELSVRALVDGLKANVTVINADGAVVAAIRGVALQPMRSRAEASSFVVEWHEDDAAGGVRRLPAARVIGSGTVADIVRGALPADSDENDENVIYLAALNQRELPETLCDEVVRLLQGGINSLVIATAGAQAVAGSRVRPHGAVLWGLARTAALEFPNADIRTVDLDPDATPNEAANRLLAELRLNSEDAAVAYRQHARYVAALTRVVPHAPESQRLILGARGNVESLHLQPIARRSPSRGEIEIEVAAAALNFKDVLQALDLYPTDDDHLGNECAGVVSAAGDGVDDLRVGDRVMAFAPSAFATHVVVAATSAALIPIGFTFEDAATIPVAFLTAYYALVHLAKLQPGETALIHAASGAVGLAAMQIAQALGARVFATAGNAEKRDYVLSRGAEAVFDSRSTSFADELPRRVDVVLNSIAGESIAASFAALSVGARFIEIGKREIWSHARAASVRPDVTYTPFDLDEIRRNDPPLMQTLWAGVIAGFARGDLRPLRRRVVPMAAAADAFRTMVRSAHVGKLVLSVERAPAPLLPIAGDATYLVTGGLGALGTAAAHWLIDRGAKSLILIGRSEADERRLTELRARGVDVVYVRGSVAAVLPRLSNIRGVIHAAGTLDDAVIANQTRDHFVRAFEAKVSGADQIRELARKSPLDFAILFSSAASVLGSSGQANYSAANAYLDATAHAMRQEGTAALSVSWGAWASSGMLASLPEEQRRRWQSLGFEPRSAEAMLAAIDPLLSSGRPHAVVGSFDWVRYTNQLQSPSARKFLANLAGHSKVFPHSAADDIRIRLRNAAPARRLPLLVDHVRIRAAHVLGVATPSQLSARVPLNDVGLDSLLAVELRNALGASLQRSLPTTLLFDYPTIDAVAGYLDGQLFAPASADDAQRLGGDDMLDALSEAEMVALLASELQQGPRA